MPLLLLSEFGEEFFGRAPEVSKVTHLTFRFPPVRWRVDARRFLNFDALLQRDGRGRTGLSPANDQNDQKAKG
ncbi:hypothetical protein N7495_003529 [Penicillium taxi]|uniref:uncharacterized protein n=1 Tax=Penicillium taxi TaxID=168475 RepID=UPI00254531FA|nr:uncharacterized protein N7495_003529 [Penicillium taxi]KAJ5898785.1 hypothetical protein N7495_003529 [Penicillium taxi]